MGRLIWWDFVFLVGMAWGQENWEQVCSAATAAPLTIPVFNHPGAESSLRHCDATALYYGFNRSPDWSAALQCAYYERAHGAADDFGGPGVLAMLYANGRGVARNYDLAIRFVCENTWAAEAETEGRIAHLEKLRLGQAERKDFDLCDDVTSGHMGGLCESVHQRFLDVKRQQKLDALSANWLPSDKEAFKALDAAEKAFADARSYYEIDREGTLREAFTLEEKGRLREQFVADLRRFAAGDIPAASASDYRSADQKLNDVYRRIEQIPDPAEPHGAVTASGVRETERVWIKYRDAWVAFAHVAYPRISDDSVRTYVTRARIEELQ